MRSIAKGREPPSLAKHRRAFDANYDDLEKQEIREALVLEQRGLCCYCMDRLDAAWGEMKIEHWQCQERYPERQLDYSNMLGACLGGEGRPGAEQHCDSRKKMKDLRYSPADPSHNVEKRIRFGIDGAIASTDLEFSAQLKDVLGLNLTVLKNRRKAVLDAMAEWLRSYRAKHHRAPDVQTLQRLLAQRSPSSGRLAPFVPVAIWWINQRLDRA